MDISIITMPITIRSSTSVKALRRLMGNSVRTVAKIGNRVFRRASRRLSKRDRCREKIAPPEQTESPPDSIKREIPFLAQDAIDEQGFSKSQSTIP